MQAPRTRKIGRSVPEIEQKWKVTVYIYVESAYEETLGCWCEARAEKARSGLLALKTPSADVLTRQRAGYSISGSCFAGFKRFLQIPRYGVSMPLAKSLLDESSPVKLRA